MPFRVPAFQCRQGIAVILAALLLLVLLCSRPAQAAGGQRILSLAPAITEMVYALGLESRVIGVSSYCNYPPAALKQPKLGAATDLNEELAVGLRPDLILVTEGDDARRARLAKLTGAKVALLPTRHVADIWANMVTIGQLTGTEAHARQVANGLRSRLEARAKALARAGTKPTVFYMVWDSPLMTAGPDSYLNDLIVLAGGSNVVTSRVGGAYPHYGWESLLAANPAYVLGPENLEGALADLKRRYPHLKAVQQGQVRTLNNDLISRPGPRVVQALEAVAAAIR